MRFRRIIGSCNFKLRISRVFAVDLNLAAIWRLMKHQRYITWTRLSILKIGGGVSINTRVRCDVWENIVPRMICALNSVMCAGHRRLTAVSSLSRQVPRI